MLCVHSAAAALTLTVGPSLAVAQVERASAIASIDPASRPFDDLAAVGDAIGDARIVEFRVQPDQGASLEAAVRLAAFLQDDLGFDAILLPAGLYEGALVGERVHDRNATIRDAVAPLFAVFRESHAIHALLSHIQETPDQIGRGAEIGGSMCQFHAEGKAEFANRIVRVFDAVDPSMLDGELRRQLHEAWSEPRRLSREPEEVRSAARSLAAQLRALFDANVDRFEETLGKREAAFERRALQNMAAFIELESIRAAGLVDAAIQFRDTAQAENLAWLLQEHWRDRRVLLFGKAPLDRVGMAADVFSIEFVAFSGRRGFANRDATSPVADAGSDALERLLHEAGFSAAFLPLVDQPADAAVFVDEQWPARPVSPTR